MIKPEEKIKVIDSYKTHDTDTGSSEVQVALLSKEIDLLLLHLKKHPKDFHSKKGLLKMVAQRRKFLRYIQQEDEKKYQNLIKKIGLKK